MSTKNGICECETAIIDTGVSMQASEALENVVLRTPEEKRLSCQIQ